MRVKVGTHPLGQGGSCHPGKYKSFFELYTCWLYALSFTLKCENLAKLLTVTIVQPPAPPMEGTNLIFTVRFFLLFDFRPGA